MPKTPVMRLRAAAALCCVFLAFLAVFVLCAVADAAELTVRCTDRDGAAVSLDTAELLAAGWGYADRVGLRTSGNTVTLPLDEDRLRSLFGEGFNQIDELFLYMEAAGYAPVRSSPFGPPGKGAGEPGEATLSFPGGVSATLTKGRASEVELVLRKPAPRSLLLLDDEGGPVQGVEVSTYMYWSSSNHCARLSGARLLDTSISGSEGVVQVPDGDIVYAFEIAAGDLGLVLREPELPEYPERLVTMLTEENTVVNLHRRKSVTLSMHIVRNGVPAAGEVLYGCMADCPGGVCASCCGPLATADSDGLIKLPGFYPEAYKSIYFQQREGGMLLESDPAKLSLDGMMEVELGGCSDLGGGI